jgi:hypothetical protein
MAAILEATALIGQNKITAAAQSILRAEAMAGTSQRTQLRAMATITASRLKIAQKQPSVALQSLSSLRAALNKSGDVQLQFATRLTQCEAELELSRKAAARTCTTSLQKDAEARGFKRVADKAKKLVP